MNAVRKTLVANYLGQGWSALMNVAFIPVYIHFLGIEAYGLIGSFAVILTCAMLLDAGMTPTLNREMARFKAGQRSAQSIADLLHSVEILCFGIIMAMSVVGVVVAGWLVDHWLGPSSLPAKTLHSAIMLMIATASLRVGEGVFRGALLGLEQTVSMNLASALFATLRAGGVIFALMLSPRLETFFLWQVGASFLSIIAFAMLTHRALPAPPSHPSFSKASLLEVRHFAGGLMATSLLTLLLTQTDKLLLVKLLPLQSFAYYALAAAVAGGLYQLVGPVAQSYYPRFTMLFGRAQMEQLADEYHRGAQILTATVAPLAAIMIFFAEPALFLWTGDAAIADRTAPILSLLAAGTLLHGMMFIPYMLQLASGWPSLAMRINAVAVTIFVPAILLIVPRYGAIGAAALWVALNAGYVLVSAQFMHRRLLTTEKRRWYVQDVAAPIAASLAVSALLSLAMPDDTGLLAMLAFLCLAGCATFAAAVSTLTFARHWIGAQARRLRLGV